MPDKKSGKPLRGKARSGTPRGDKPQATRPQAAKPQAARPGSVRPKGPGGARRPGPLKKPAPPVAKKDLSPEDKAEKGERIAKVIARAGLCSRRDAERWITEGRVKLDGKTLDSAAIVVMPGQSIIVDGKALPAPERARVWRFHKPKGVITTRKDPEGRPTVFDGLPDDLPRLEPVGRLDFNSEGLLLFTNDGELKRKLELPSTGWSRRYRVRVHGKVDPAQIKELENGITVEGINYGPIQARLEHQAVSNAWIAMTLREGKNREIRRICEHLGLVVNRLIRVSYGPFQLGDLAPGKIEAVPVRVLQDQLGRKASDIDEEPDPVPAKTPLRGKPARARTTSPVKSAGPDRNAGGNRNARTFAPARTLPPKGATDLSDSMDDKRKGAGSKTTRVKGRKTDRTETFRSGAPKSTSSRLNTSGSDKSRSDKSRSDGARAGKPGTEKPRFDKTGSGAFKTGKPKPGKPAARAGSATDKKPFGTSGARALNPKAGGKSANRRRPS
jgi:23S rRNA pseudouridine2605 synthase